MFTNRIDGQILFFSSLKFSINFYEKKGKYAKKKKKLNIRILKSKPHVRTFLTF